MTPPETIVVFPGQGSQRSGMGRDFHGNFAAARRVYEEGSEALGLDLPALCIDNDPRPGLTEFAQPGVDVAGDNSAEQIVLSGLAA